MRIITRRALSDCSECIALIGACSLSSCALAFAKSVLPYYDNCKIAISGQLNDLCFERGKRLSRPLSFGATSHLLYVFILLYYGCRTANEICVTCGIDDDLSLKRPLLVSGSELHLGPK